MAAAVLSNSGGQENLSGGIVKKIPIYLPPLSLQKEISEAAQDITSQANTLDRLIAKKHAVKQGMVQQLLTGKVRLPGFNDGWRTVHLGDLLEFKNGLNKSKEFFGSGTPIVNFMDVLRNPILKRHQVQGQVTLLTEEIKRFSARRGDIFFTRTSESIDEVGTASVLIDAIPDAVFSGFVLRGRPRANGLDPVFLAYCLRTSGVRAQITATATYTTRALTNGKALSRIWLSLPPLAEQQRIGAVLMDLDLELATRERRLEKAKTVKQGLMQELLTDRSRLPVKEGAV